MNEIREHKERRSGRLTPLQILEDAIEKVKAGRVTGIIVIGINDEQVISAGNSTMKEYVAYGMLETAKDIIREGENE